MLFVATMSALGKVLVTGANGHIGSNVIRALLAAGSTPIGFVRDKSDRRALAGLDVELRVGDLLDTASLERAMDGVEIVFHVGAVHRNFAPDPASIERPAIDGTKNAIQAARKRGVRRVVLTSSGATIGFAPDPARPLDESHFLDKPHSAYIRGKVLSERLALLEAMTGTPDIVVLNPSGVFGPFDYRLTPATRALIGLLQGDPAFLTVSVTDVRDVAKAHLLAAESGAPGRRYLVTGDVVAPKELAALYRDLAGIKPLCFRPPGFLLRWLGRSAIGKARRSGTDTPFDPDALEDLAGGHLAYDSTRSRSELGMTYRPARQVLGDAFRWLLHVGALKPAVAAKVKAKLGEHADPDPDWGVVAKAA
jgi:dihydroflavonol-4-reductase